MPQNKYFNSSPYFKNIPLLWVKRLGVREYSQKGRQYSFPKTLGFLGPIAM
jgi:hypothetical protein